MNVQPLDEVVNSRIALPFIGDQPMSGDDRRRFIRAITIPAESGMLIAADEVHAIATTIGAENRPLKAIAMLLSISNLLSVAAKNCVDPRWLAVDSRLAALFALVEDLPGCSAVVLALQHAVERAGPEPWSERSFAAFRSIVLDLCVDVTLSFDAAMDLVDKIEDAGFDVYSEALDEIADWGKDDEQAAD